MARSALGSAECVVEHDHREDAGAGVDLAGVRSDRVGGHRARSGVALGWGHWGTGRQLSGVAVISTDKMITIIEPVTGEVLAEHRLVTPGETSILDDHYGQPRPARPRRARRPRTQTEKDFLALGCGRAVLGRPPRPVALTPATSGAIAVRARVGARRRTLAHTRRDPEPMTG